MNAFDIGVADGMEKTAVVHKSVKQYRRAFQMMAEGSHDWHGASKASMVGNLAAGKMRTGKGALSVGETWFSRGKPELTYFQHGHGIAIPKNTTNELEHVGYGKNWIAHKKDIPIPARSSIVATGNMMDAQKRLKARVIHPDMMYLAHNRRDEILRKSKRGPITKGDILSSSGHYEE